MDTKTLKSLIKSAVKEAIQEELKDILLEAIKSPRNTVIENHSTAPSYSSRMAPVPVEKNLSMDFAKKRQIYESLLEETAQPINTNNIPFIPTPGIDTVNGSLPPGDVSISQIMNLMS